MVTGYLDDNSKSAHFVINNKKISADGSVTSLIDGAGTDKDVVMEEYSCSFMFLDCSALTTAPKLIAEKLTDYCYKEMFNGCTSLINPPKLQATELAPYCYTSMFYGCASLSDLPVLPAVKLATGCYCSMFSSCTSIKIKTEKGGNYTKEWSIPASASECEDWRKAMFFQIGEELPYAGTSVPTPGTTYYLYVSSQSGNTSSSGKSSSSGSVGIKAPRNTGTGNWNQPTTGAWTKTKDGKWNFGNTEIKTFKKVWGYIYNKKAKKNEPQAHWYYFDENGTMLTGWQTIQGQVYYFSEKDDASLGRMLTGWQKINHKWYYFNETRTSKGGRMLKDTTTPDGYKVGVDGVWIQ